jgi:hypothetical protein
MHSMRSVRVYLPGQGLQACQLQKVCRGADAHARPQRSMRSMCSMRGHTHTHTHTKNTGTIERERIGEKERKHALHAVTMLQCYDLVSKDFLDQRRIKVITESAHSP